MLKLPSLYFKDSSDNIRIWTIIVDKDEYYTEAGVIGGKIQTSKPKKAKGKNTGKKNQTTAEEQANLEANRIWEDKIHEGYVRDKEKAKIIAESRGFFSPMLAKSLDECEIDYSYKVFCQPKFDGFRFSVSATGGLSRNGKPIFTADHIITELAPVFKKYPNIVLDGELYNHDYKDDFNKLQSLLTKKNISLEEQFEIEDKIQFHIYDCCTPGKDESFYNRNYQIKGLFNEFTFKNVKQVETFRIYSEDDRKKYYAKFMEEGYEGQMVRLNLPYENKRTKSLIKVKEFIESEYLILDILPGKGNKSHIAGSIRCVNNAGDEFNSNIKANWEICENLIKNKHLFIGKYGTLKYFQLSEYGIPRFPYLLKIRDGIGGDEIDMLSK